MEECNTTHAAAKIQETAKREGLERLNERDKEVIEEMESTRDRAGTLR